MNNYIEQTAFVAGEISPEVASRSELDKYQYALLKARNVYIRPYGSCYRRPGTKYHTACKYGDKKAILVEFSFAVGISYYLEIGDKYIRIHRDGKYLGIELITPFTEADLPKLRFAQSADVMYITSGKYPVKTLSRYAEDNWRFKDFEITEMYYDTAMMNESYNAGGGYQTPGSYTFVPTITGDYYIEIAGAGGGGGGSERYAYGKYGGNGGTGELITIQKITLNKDTSYSVTVGAGGSAGRQGTSGNPSPSDGGNGGSSSITIGETAYTARGGGGGKAKYRNNSGGANGTSYSGGGQGGLGGAYPAQDYRGASAGKNGWVIIRYAENKTITPSGTVKEITLTANADLFSEANVSTFMKIQHEMPSKTVSTTNGTTEGVKVGDSWKVISHGTWSGNFAVEKSNDNGGTWEEYRKYTGKEDYNPSESGTVEEPCLLRIKCSTSGSCNVDLTALPYTHEGTVKITEYISATQVKADVITELGSTEATPDFYWGAWSDEFGYPSCVCFFQDRLCFACTTKQPYMLWMSRTGDYGNFGVEKADGTVTDDSAIALSFITRKQYNILHIIPAADLIVLTEGNEWLISGSNTVTPTSVTPKTQTSRGTTDVEPLHIGAKIVFVQRRGKVVRDIGYTFESDQYDGSDLTILAKHLTQNTEIVDSAYQQEPNNIIYFVTDDGGINCLTYVQDQNVYAWSKLTTDGEFESVCNIEGETQDTVYTIVKRTVNGQTMRYIESFTAYPDSDNPDDYVMLDSAVIFNGKSSYSVPHLAGKTIDVLADGRAHKDITVAEDGSFEIPATATNVIAGLPYETTIEIPNIAINGPDGSLQGRFKKISDVYVRLYNSLGGKLGHEEDYMDEIIYDEFSEDTVKLYSGTKRVTAPNVPSGGYLDESSIMLKTSEPYPFNLSLVVRSVTL